LQQTFEQWRIVFWILAGTYMVGASMFLIFGTAKTLPWNSTTKKEGANGFSINESETLKPLKIEQSS
jgi:ACS family sodium-dependent inorganic phosphate cotransporter